jgi:HAE1 family hydrophobic/amphiphilic exporter-1
MEEVSGPVIAIALILAAVFVPTAFVPGITGQLYKQFAVTIAVSVLFSAFNALTLSPALSALLLRPRKPARGPLGAFFRWFNRVFGRATDGYVSWCGLLIRKAGVAFILLAALTVGAGLFGKALPGPDETRDISMPACSCRMRLRSNDPEAAREVEKAIWRLPVSTMSVRSWALAC